MTLSIMFKRFRKKHGLYDLRKEVAKFCGKEFESGTDYAYKIERKHGRYFYFCSWHCIQEYRRTGTKKVQKAQEMQEAGGWFF